MDKHDGLLRVPGAVTSTRCSSSKRTDSVSRDGEDAVEKADVVIAGGGPAGCAVAAALSDLGMSVLLLDAGVDRHKQLSGELLQPAGVRDLRALGFGDVVEAWPAQPVRGIAVRYHAPERTFLLPYEEGAIGLSLEHAALTMPLLESAIRRPGVTLLGKARVTAVERNDASGVRLRYAHEGAEHTVQARLLVAADGRASSVRRMLGITERHTRVSTMLGVTVDSDCLRPAEHIHQFVGGPLQTLAYAIQPGVARVMIDLPLGSSARMLKDRPELLSTLPPALGAAILRALEEGPPPRMASNDARLPKTVWAGSAVLVGDAAACCHPLTGSGMASCFHDARALQEALRRHPGSIPRALEHYATTRRPAQRTRLALAAVLHGIFAGQDDAMQAMRLGLRHYWEHNPRAIHDCMTLLTWEKLRMWPMALEYLRVAAHALIAMFTLREGRPRSAVPVLRSIGRPLRDAVASALEQLGRWLVQHSPRSLASLVRHVLAPDLAPKPSRVDGDGPKPGAGASPRRTNPGPTDVDFEHLEAPCVSPVESPSLPPQEPPREIHPHPPPLHP
jgi:squalene monooxygenase